MQVLWIPFKSGVKKQPLRKHPALQTSRRSCGRTLTSARGHKKFFQKDHSRWLPLLLRPKSLTYPGVGLAAAAGRVHNYHLPTLPVSVSPTGGWEVPLSSFFFNSCLNARLFCSISGTSYSRSINILIIQNIQSLSRRSYLQVCRLSPGSAAGIVLQWDILPCWYWNAIPTDDPCLAPDLLEWQGVFFLCISSFLWLVCKSLWRWQSVNNACMYEMWTCLNPLPMVCLRHKENATVVRIR